MTDASPRRPHLSVVIPAFNESHRLPQTLAEIRPYLEAKFPEHEVVVVDDGSSDLTAQLVRESAAAWPRLRLLQQPRNIGKGAAVKRGVLESTGEFVLFMDADHATPIDEVERFLPRLESGEVSVVVGVRTYQRDESKWRRILGLGLQMAAHLIVFDRAVLDSQCGFKCFRADVAKDVFTRCRIDGGMFDVEIFQIMHKLNVAIYNQAVPWDNKSGSRINILRCVVFDVVDMAGIRMNALLGRYRSVPQTANQAAQGVSPAADLARRSG